MLADPVTAQTFTNLYSFTLSVSYNNGSPINSDGAWPYGTLILSGNTLYGTASAGGSSGNGTVFAVNTDGTGFTNLYNFTAFKHSNPNNDGAIPECRLVLSGDTLYGTAYYGGTNGNGTIFSISTNGTDFTNLYIFSAGSGYFYPYDSYPFITNSDGAAPIAGLTLSGNTLYGTASGGGSGGVGTVFAINTDGTDFTNLYNFTAPDLNTGTNSDGAQPVGGLILSGSTLYGTASRGGSSSFGTVFAVNTNGTDFTNLYDFTATEANTNGDGAFPDAGLILSGNILYGAAAAGGSSGYGTVFAINTNGSNFMTLHSFIGSDGSVLEAGLILSGNILYGAAGFGGSANNGTIFSLSLPLPQLTITPSGTNVILTWPTNGPGIDYSGFTLQSTTNLVSPAGWSTVVPVQGVVNGLNTVTNPISGTQQFYRLIQSMALIPAGVFTIGDTLDGESDAIPTNVYVSAFYMDVNLVSLSQWQSIYNWATNNGYSFVNAGDGLQTAKAANYPVENVDWYDSVKWCNARSAQAGLTPVYYADTNLTQVFTNGETTNVYANWTANGYRLPTEAEWEKAARGGDPGSFAYDLSTTNDYDPAFSDADNFATAPFTSPVGYFPANGYGLNDMAGNVDEWCWDCYASTPYPAGSPYLGGTDPRGPVGPLNLRVLRAGDWNNPASHARCASRGKIDPGSNSFALFGFRCVRKF
jgi:uncharacterized repeat protein (TIGR03803 family)